MDNQITHIIVEIDKFDKTEHQIKSDLDKLISIMKNLEHIEGLDQLPKTLTEDWIEQAVKKVDKSQMTLEQRMHFEMMLARNASIIEMRKEEQKRFEEETKKRIEEEANKKLTEEKRRNALTTAKKFKELGVDITIISETTDLTEEEIQAL